MITQAVNENELSELFFFFSEKNEEMNKFAHGW